MYVGIEGAIKIAITVMILVFIILGLLALMMVGLREIVKLTSKKKTEEKKVIFPEKVKTITEKPGKEGVKKTDKEYDERLIAVISAAVSTFMSRPMNKVKIINIKRYLPAGASPWSISGKQSVMSNRISIGSRKRGGF
jgi:Na+-transporting methylmalonyl-CoA/oxaloacetate decarboxylase gamma subunit